MPAFEASSDLPAERKNILLHTPLMALAVAAFGIGTSEFIIMGLLPNLADDFHVRLYVQLWLQRFPQQSVIIRE